MKQPAVLDFTADGGAVVRIADVGEVAYLDMFGFSPISKVESDIEHADTSERKRFPVVLDLQSPLCWICNPTRYTIRICNPPTFSL